MTEQTEDELTEMLADGWAIVGYTVNMLAAGAQHYNLLLRKDNRLVNFGILYNGPKELGRGATVLAPYTPSPKKGFWG